MSRLQDIQWWLDHTEGHQEVGDGYLVRCPAHNDGRPSLHLTVDSSGVTAHCFAGCTYQEILQSIPNTSIGVSFTPLESPPSSLSLGSNEETVREWWREYTGISDLVWESWGVSFTAVTVDFTWENSPVKKKRKVKSKLFEWSPSHSASPPFWPTMGVELPERIFIIGGETDTGVLRMCGYDAYALMKGENFRGGSSVWSALYQRGVREVIFGLDADEVGLRSSNALALEAQTASLSVGFIRTESLVDILLGEKDFRNVWLRIGRDIPRMRDMIENSIEMLVVQSSQRLNIITFLERSISNQPWLVDRMVLKNTVHLIVGPPKMKKTWLALDLGISIATNRPFLGSFGIGSPGRVIYISKEDPDYLLHDRLGKIMIGKGLGGRIEEYRITLPPRRYVPFEVDLNRNFYFTPPAVEELITWIEDTGGAEAVIFDPILRMIPEGVDEYKAGEIEQSIFRSTERIRSETGAAVILVHHKSKGAGEKSTYGSIAFRAFGEGAWYLLGDEPDTDGYTQVRNEYKSAPELTWEYRFDDLEFRYSVEAQERHIGRRDRPDVIRDLIFHRLETIYPNGMTVNDMIRIFNGPTDFQIREALTRLEDSNEIYREKEDLAVGQKGKRRDVWYWKNQSS